MSLRPRILVVEDDEQLGRMLRTMMRDVADVAHARDGRDALTWLALNPTPDAIIADRAMPNLDGLALVKALKDDDRWRSVPVLMLTANAAGPRGMVDAINAGVRHYVTKPFQSRQLLAKVQKMLSEPRSRSKTWRAPALATPIDERDVILLSEQPELVEPSDVTMLDADFVELEPSAVTLLESSIPPPSR